MNKVQDGVCRLCGSGDGILIPIFEGPEEHQRCLSKIEILVPDVVILRYDSLPKQVCHRCYAKVREFYEFRERCIQTQNLLKQQYLPWLSVSGNHRNKCPPRVTSPTVTYMGGPLAYPFGDDEVEILTLSDDEDVSMKQCTSISGFISSKKDSSKGALMETKGALMENSVPQVPVKDASESTCFSKPPPLTWITQPVHLESNSGAPKPAVETPILRHLQQQRAQSNQSSPLNQSVNGQSFTVVKPLENPIQTCQLLSISPTSDPLAGGSTSNRKITLCTDTPHGSMNTAQEVSQSCSRPSKPDKDSSNVRATIRRPKPKPKCKQKKSSPQPQPVGSREAAGYSCINITSDNVIFTCNKCNKIFIKMDSYTDHSCSQINSNKKLDFSADSSLLSLCENSNDSSSSVELLDC